jgi:hypothetical protein
LIGGLEVEASYGPKSALALDTPASPHGSEAADAHIDRAAKRAFEFSSTLVSVQGVPTAGYASKPVNIRMASTIRDLSRSVSSKATS